MYQKVPNVTNKIEESNMICAHALGKGACTGDRGSPLMTADSQSLVVIGIASWGKGCGEGFPDVYARVTSVLLWIEKEMKRSNGTICPRP